MDWVSKTIGIIGIILGVIILFYPFVFKWIKSPKYISFKEAIKIVGDCGHYDVNNHDQMWQSMNISREQFYKGQIDIFINKKEVTLYGRKIYSSNKELQKIEITKFKKLCLEDDYKSLSSKLSDGTCQNVYTDLSFEKKELYSAIEKFKKQLSYNLK